MTFYTTGFCEEQPQTTERAPSKVSILPSTGGVNPYATVNETTDAAADSSTIYQMEVGDSFTGTLNPTGEHDWVRIDLDPGAFVQISMTGGSLSDPFLRLYDSGGNVVAFNDDFIGLDSQLNYASETGGTFYIDAGSFSDSGAGTYTLDVVDASYDPLDSLDWGSALGSTHVDYYFAPNGYTADGITSEGFNAYAMQQFAEALEIYASYTGLTFAETNNPADAEFTFIWDTNEMGGGLYGYFNPPGEVNAGVGAFNGNLLDDVAGGNMDRGGFAFMVLLHELGHAFGLSHPHDTGGSSTIMPGVVNSSSTGVHSLNQGIFTTMSYMAGFIEGPTGTVRPGGTELYGSQGGPMALDLGILQNRYGINPTQNAGNTVFELPTSNLPGTYWEAISDVGGIDTIVNPGSGPSTIDLNAATLLGNFGGGGFVSAVDGIAGGFTIASGTVIENAIGGSGYDLIIGNGANNQLTGGDGYDTIFGNGGDDLINGDTGRDSLTGDAGNDTVNGGGAADTIDGGLGADTLRGNDGDDSILGGGFGDLIYGGNQHDTIRGEDGPDTIIGGGGNDSLIGGGNTDSILGGDGADTILGNVGNDTLEGGTGTDSITGGDGRDLISGNTGNDTLIGNKADDTIDGGGGSDSILGGDDNDSLTGQSGSDTIKGGNGDDYIEGNDLDDWLEGNGGLDTILGGAGDDTIDGGGDADLINGDDGADLLIGAEGNDTIYGNEGPDTLVGQEGDDRLYGGQDSDQFQFAGMFGNDTVYGFSEGNDVIEMQGYVAGDLTLTSSGGSTIVEIDGSSETIRIQNVVLTDFSDFIFT